MNLYFYAPYWYGYLNTVAYWWEDEAHTTPAKRLPTSSDTAHILSDAFYGTCNAGLTIVKQGIEFGKWGATATGDLQVAQLGDYWGYEYGFKRIKIGNGNWIGPKRYYFVVEDDESSSSSCSSSSCHHDHNNNSSLSGEPDLGNPANWRTSPGGTSGGNVPGPSDIGILCNENSSSYSQGPSVSAYGTCNAGLLFNTYNAGYSTDWSSVLDGAVINGAMIERSALSSHSTFNGPYFARDVVSPGRLSYYYCSDLSSNTFNGQTFIHNDPDGVGYYSNMDPGYWLSNDMFSHAMFNGDLAVGGAMIIPPDVAKRVFSRGNRLSIDLGKTWLVPQSMAAATLSLQDVEQIRYRLGLDGTATPPSTGTPNFGPVERNAIADAVLSRSVANVEASANVKSLCYVALAMANANTTAHPGKLTVFRTNGVTEFAQRTITSKPGADSVTGVGP